MRATLIKAVQYRKVIHSIFFFFKQNRSTPCFLDPSPKLIKSIIHPPNVRFHVDSASWLLPETKAAISKHLELSRDGWLIVKSDRTESRTLNMADALEKLRVNIRKAENPVTETFMLKENEMSRKAKLKAARERLHIKQ